MKKLLLICTVVIGLFVLQASVMPVQATPQCQNAGGYQVHITGVAGDYYAAAEIRGREVIPFALNHERITVNVQFASTYIIIDNRISAPHIDGMIVGVFTVPADLQQCEARRPARGPNVCPPDLPPWLSCHH